MKVYYEIYNVTKGLSVSYNRWKNENCDCHMIMHRYLWDIDDNIYSESHNIDTCSHNIYVFAHNEENNTMIPIDVRQYYQIDDSDYLPKKFRSDKEKIMIKFDCCEFERSRLKITKDHAPIWDGNQCVICSYEHSPFV